MAEDDSYLQAHFLDMDTFAPWMGMETMNNFSSVSHATSARIVAVDGPYLQIVEQPKQRGFRFRYGCEGPSHGGLPGASSERNRRSYPQVKICNYQGPARVVVQLVTSSAEPHFHAHSLVGKQCEKGVCIADLPPKDTSISFPNLGILHVTKKNVSKTLEERMTEAFRMGYNYGVAIHPEIDCLQGEVRIPREFTEQQKSLISSAAVNQAKEMDLSVVRLMFTAFLPDSDGGYSRRLDPVISEPIYDSKAPNASNLKIVRMDRTAGCVTGGEEVYLLCDKVQKDDIQVRFYEEDDTGQVWEAYGDFSPTDVHRQFAIVFKTPKYRNLNLQKPISVFVQLKRKSDNETSEPKPFTYHPQVIDKEEVQRKRQKTLPNFQDYGPAGGSGGMFRGGAGGGGGPAAGAGPGTGAGPSYYQGYGYGTGSYGSGYSFSQGSGGTGMKHASQGPSGDDDGSGPGGDDDSEDDAPGAGGAACLRGPPAADEEERRETETPLAEPERADGPEGDSSMCALQDGLLETARRQAQALFHYAMSGDVRMLLALQRPLMTSQDEDGDTCLHLGVIHSRTTALCGLAQVISALPGEDVVNMRNDLYQTPLHLAVVTQQEEAVTALLEAGADATLADRHGNTALHLAAQQSDGRMAALLLQHPQMVKLIEQPNATGLCPIHLAVQASSLGALRELLSGGAHVEAQELSSGRTALHLATERDDVSLAGCLLLEGNAHVDSCTYDGSTPLHVAAGRGSVKLSALLMAAGADPHKENCEPLYDTEEDRCPPGEDEEGEEDEGFIPGTTPLDIAPCTEVYDILNGKRYQPSAAVAAVPPQGDMKRLGEDTRRALCHALEQPTSTWEGLAQALGLGVLNSAFRLSASPAHTLLDSYEVSGGTLKELEEALRLLGSASALDILQGALVEAVPSSGTAEELAAAALDVLDLKDRGAEDGGICDSGVETSYMKSGLSLSGSLCGPPGSS
ncbi:nuclear factor NF-kappa-B p105 subunit-like [Scleropages formosus]|uniref:Nuclear factor kappa B subunit 1 n=1 Tax=Scleropages formosus TaxID=113540 RepID=A0A8C9WVD9_SCLFO|nr:nuclear factor NF-kappa-B p105 subunit [Scleropages formosus]